MRASFSCGDQGLVSGCCAQASCCRGFSCHGAQAPGAQTSVAAANRPEVAAPWIHSTDSVVMPWLRCSSSCGIFWTRDGTCVPCVGKADSHLLSHQGSPLNNKNPNPPSLRLLLLPTSLDQFVLIWWVGLCSGQNPEGWFLGEKNCRPYSFHSQSLSGYLNSRESPSF